MEDEKAEVDFVTVFEWELLDLVKVEDRKVVLTKKGEEFLTSRLEDHIEKEFDKLLIFSREAAKRIHEKLGVKLAKSK